MAETTQLSTNDLVLARLCCREMERNGQAWQDVLLHAQFRNIKRVNHVLAVHGEEDGPIDRHGQGAHDDIIPRRDVIRRVKAKVVPVSVPDPFRMDDTEPTIWACITEIEGKLFSGYINMQGA